MLATGSVVDWVVYEGNEKRCSGCRWSCMRMASNEAVCLSVCVCTSALSDDDAVVPGMSQLQPR